MLRRAAGRGAATAMWPRRPCVAHALTTLVTGEAAVQRALWPHPRICPLFSSRHCSTTTAYVDNVGTIPVEQRDTAADCEDLPPWRQKKPSRWIPDEDDSDSSFFSLPREQGEAETGRSWLLGVGGVAIIVYFMFFWWSPPA
eukprot:TRINITY_DN75226_c0_g1_i1.p1 TRINITY_DN75226_c0_g1~~TRINITY_DN75226_c0_g1_i1.p1  ORF type:complete len:142 (-),score=20.73 TRINITY_DN75226_c0_g1_i1:129-554(-)